MKWHQWRGARRLIVALTLLVALTGVGALLWGFSQAAVASPAPALYGSYKAAAPLRASPGSEVAYEIVLANSSPDVITNVVVRDELSLETTYQSGSWYGMPEGQGIAFQLGNGVLTFTVPTIQANGAVTLGYTVLLDTGLTPDTVLTNTAVISDGTATLTRSVAVTVAGAPTARLDVPWDNYLITRRDTFEIRGRAWTDTQDPEFPAAPVLKPIVYQTGRDWYQVEWEAVAGEVSYILQESEDAHFADVQAYTPTTELFLDMTDKAVGTYYYRVKARNAYGDSFWSNVVSVTVTPDPAGLQAAAAPEAVLADYQPVVEINIRPVEDGSDNWVAVDAVTAGLGDWWDWTYTWEDLPEEDGVEYLVQARALDLAGNFDAALIDTVTVTISNAETPIYLPLIARRWPPVPLPPTLSVPSNDGLGNYTLAWTYPHTQFTPTSYELQEATDEAFTSPTVFANATSPREFTGKEAGTYYYRLRGINIHGPGEWSNVVAVVAEAPGFFDDFTNPASGWPREVYRENERGVFDVAYDAGKYRAKIMLDTDGLNNYRYGTVRSPWANPFGAYEVEVEHIFARAGDQLADPLGGKAVLIFGANENYSTQYVVEWNWDGLCAVTRYVNVGTPLVDVRNLLGSAQYYRGWGVCDPVRAGYDQVNVARVVVDGNRADVYINNTLITSFTDTGLGSARLVGLGTGSWERTPVDSRFDNFRVTPR